MRALYTTWDGSQTVRLRPDAVFEELARHLSATDDLAEALDRLLRQGIDEEGMQVVGLDELLERVREAMEDLFDRYNLRESLAEQRTRLDDAVAAEEKALEDLDEDDPRRRNLSSLARLPQRIDEALDRLGHWDFLDEDAARAVEELEVDGDDIRRVAQFVRRHGESFRGPESLDFDETRELLERFEALRDLEQALLGRNLEDIDAEAMGALVGEEAGAALEALRGMMMALAGAGYLARKGARMVLSPKGARALGQIALREIFAQLDFEAAGRHDTRRRQGADVDIETSRAHASGDPMNIDVFATLGNALKRGSGLPIRMQPGDVAVFETRRNTRAATVLLLDMSWSMSWEGRFAAAKKVALAMECLMRTRYPRDFFAVVGFYTRAVRVELAELPEVTWNMGDPFTNLQDGLRMAAEMLGRSGAGNRQIILITDGQPTAYFSQGRLFCEWPMSAGGLSTRATVETLKEVEYVTRRGITINTFMLDDSPVLRAFVEKLTAINKGRAFYTTPSELGHFLMVDYVGRRRRVL